MEELLTRINQRHYGLTKSVKSITPTTAPSTATFPLPLPAGAPVPTDHLTPKDAQNVSKIQSEYTKIEQLQEEKVHLAQRLERIVGRARERGKAEWKRVGGMDIDELDNVKLGDLGSADVLLPLTGLGSGTSKRSRKPALPLAAAISAGSSMGALSRGASPAGSMPPPPVPRAGSMGRGRGRPKREPVSEEEEDADAEVEAEIEVPEGMDVEADDQPYCFCQQKSYGEMIGCDNDKCPYEWVRSYPSSRANSSSTSSVSTSTGHCPIRGTAQTASRRSALPRATGAGPSRTARAAKSITRPASVALALMYVCVSCGSAFIGLVLAAVCHGLYASTDFRIHVPHAAAP